MIDDINIDTTGRRADELQDFKELGGTSLRHTFAFRRGNLAGRQGN